jgi:hypothetical protein
MIVSRTTHACLILVGCLCLSACQQETANSQESTAAPVIGQLKTTDKLITVHAGEWGSIYKVTSHKGVVLGANLSKEELIAKYPELKQVIEQGIADWADLDVKYQENQAPNDK